jgi:hypothetical protein
MVLRRAWFLLPAVVLACSSSSDPTTHGPVIDASSDSPMDELPDSSSDAGKDSGGHDAGHDSTTPPDAPAEAAPPEDGPAPDGSMPTDASSCKGTVALAGGTSSVAFGATRVNGGSWNVTSLSTGTASINPSLVAFGGGFTAVFTAATTNYLQYSSFASSTWSAAASADGSSCPGAPAGLGAPGIAAIGTTLHSVYLGTDNDFFHGTFTKAAGWDCQSDPLTPSGGSQSFGPSAPAVASDGTTLVAVFDGSDNGLYAQTWTSSGWATAAPIMGAGVGTIPPTLIRLNGGTSDLLLVYEDKTDDVIEWATYTSGVWSIPAATSATATTLSPVSVAPLAKGAAVLAFLGTDGNPYSMTFDPGASTPWSAPTPIVTMNQLLTTPPSVATGVCGTDAIAAIVQPAGIETASLSAGTWSAPSLVSGTSSMSYASIATSP